MTANPTPDRSIFLEAIEIASASERQAFVARACRGDDQLQAVVEGLLAAHYQSGDLLDFPDRESRTTDQSRAVTGTQIGPYKLIELIGEGGMGTVWMAQQTEPVKRLVALKLIKAGMDTRQVIARFEAERQALAVMDHPNIAKVLDGGEVGQEANRPQDRQVGNLTHLGRPYFVMELVRGVPITKYCDEHQLTPRQRLELFIPVCHAIQHAHQKGIIHRDLKPSNVLVALYDDKPVPKVIDFGVAKATGQSLTDKTLVTGFGAIVGTLEYMSPEQAEVNQLDIDTRSDIYSLGVLLYELLTGSPPFSRKQLEKVGMLEMLRVIREEEPSKPSTKLSTAEGLPTLAANRGTEPAKLTKLVRGELDWIVMKALEKDRSRRYETANGLALDVHRYLDDEPVLACPPSAAYRFQKFARRNKGALAVAAATLVVLITAAVASSMAASRFRALAKHNASLVVDKESALQKAIKAEAKAATARDSEHDLREEAERQAKMAARQRDRANASAGRARRAVDEYLSRVTDEELLSAPGLQPLRQELLAAALRFYGEFTAEQGDDTALQAEVASAHYRLGRIHNELGNGAAARAANLEAVRMIEALRERKHATAETLSVLAQAYLMAGRNEDSIQLCQLLLKDDPGAIAARRTLADTYNMLGVKAFNARDYAAALQYHQQAFAVREELVRRHPDDAGFNAELGCTLNNIGVLLNGPDQAGERLRMLKQALEYAETACRLAPHSILWGRWLATSNRNIGYTERGLGNGSSALTAFERQATEWQRLVFQNPAATYLRGDHYRALLELADQQERMELTFEANRTRRDAREVLAQLPKKLPSEVFELATVHAALATPPDRTQEAGGEEDPEAADERERHTVLAMQMLKKAIDAGWADSAVLRNHRALDPLRKRDDFQLLAQEVETLAAARQVAAGQSPSNADTLASQQKVAEQLRNLAAQPGNAVHRKLQATMLHSIGVIQSELKQFVEAEKSLQEALVIREEFREGGGSQAKLDAFTTQYTLGKLYWDSERHSKAHRLWQQTLTALDEFSAAPSADAAVQRSAGDIERNICDHYGRIGLWSLAAEHAVRNVRYHRPTHISWDAQFAALLARSPEDYRQYCRAVFEHMQPRADSRPAWELAQLAWLLGQGEDAGLASLDEPVRYSRKARELDPEPSWFVHAVALIQYRAGRHSDAATTLDQDRSSAHLGGSGTRYLWALANLPKDKQVARRHFDEAERMYRDAIVRAVASDPPALPAELQWNYPTYWWHLVHTQTLRAEAHRRFRGADARADDPWQHLIQARGYRLIGETERSNEELAAAFEVAEDKLLVQILRARLYEEFGQTAEAAADWKYVLAHARGADSEWIERHSYFAKLLPAAAAANNSAPAPAAAAQPPLAVVPFSAEEAVRLQQAWADHLRVPVAIENSLGMKFRLIPPGVFDMGTPPALLEKLSPAMKAANASAILEQARLQEHDVCVFLTQPFYLAECEVTVGQFRQFVAATGFQTDGEKSGLGGYATYQSKWQRHASHLWKSPAEGWPLAENQPVVHISWNDTKAFCEWLSEKDSVRYTVPTEAQWEFACRAGSTAVYGASDDPKSLELVAWTKNSGITLAQPVGSKLPNPFGLFDMLGNVYEWTSDNYAPGRRDVHPLVNPRQLPTFNGKVIRGLPWYQPAEINRIAQRNSRADNDPHDCGQGFRLAIIGDFRQGLPAALQGQDPRALAQSQEQRATRQREAAEDALRRKQVQDSDAHVSHGWALYREQKFVESERAFREAVKLAPKSARAHYGLGHSLSKLQQLPEAVAEYHEAIRLNPAEPDVHRMLGWALGAQKQFTEAEEAFREAVRLVPGDANAHHGRGHALLQLGRRAEAEKALIEALRLDPNHPATQNLLKQARLPEAPQERFPEGLAAFREAVRLNPMNHYARAKVAWTLLDQAKFAEAETEFRELISRQADSFDGHFGLGRTLVSRKKDADAIAPLREATRLDPKHAGPHGTLGWAHMHLQQYSEAEKAFREQIRLTPPESANGLEGLGKALLKQEKYLEAMAPLREGIRLDADNHLFREALGWALVHTGDPAGAEAEFSRAIGLKPAWVPGHIGLGRALVDQRKYAAAEDSLREALRLEPENKSAAELLERAKRGESH